MRRLRYLIAVLAIVPISGGCLATPNVVHPGTEAYQQARARVFAACKWNKLAFLEGATPDKICASLDEGVRVISGHNPDSAKVGRAHQMRTMPV